MVPYLERFLRGGYVRADGVGDLLLSKIEKNAQKVQEDKMHRNEDAAINKLIHDREHRH